MSLLNALSQGGFEITPAYGRDYKSRAAAMADWNANKDFTMRPTGQSINKSDATKCLKGKTLLLRYNNLRLVYVVNV